MILPLTPKSNKIFSKNSGSLFSFFSDPSLPFLEGIFNNADQDILKLINNLGAQDVVTQASLGNMNYRGKAGDAANVKKNFTIIVDVKG